MNEEMEFSAIAGMLQSRPVRVATAMLGPLVTAAILGGFRDDVTSATAALVQVVWVVAAAASADRAAGLLAAISGAAWFDFFLTAPYHQFAISDADDIEIAVLLVIIGVIVTELALWGHRQQAGAARRSGYLDGVLKAAEAVAEDQTPRLLLTSIIAQQIAAVMEVPDCRYVEGSVKDSRIARVHPDGTVTRNNHPVDVARQGLPTDEEVAVPVHRGALTYGYFSFNSATQLVFPTTEQLRVAVLLANQTAAALAERG
jgi:K+-sensing histidine kinase KdpD